MPGPWGECVFSQAEVQPSRARLVVDCKEAPDSVADLRHPECLSAVLGHLEREFGIESVVLSHYVEKQYGSRTMDTLRRTLGLASLFSQVGSRPPSPKFPGFSKKQIALKCAACPFHPRTLFRGLREDLLRDFAAFHGAFADIAEKLYRYREPGCRTCTAATTNDMIYVFQEVARFGEAVLRTAPPPEAPR